MAVRVSLITLLLLGVARGLVVSPARPLPQLRTPLPAAAAAAAPAARGWAAARMQVAEPPVKIPDTIPPDLAPTKPVGDKSNEKGKKYKLLLFNDNVNRCARILFLLSSPLSCACVVLPTC